LAVPYAAPKLLRMIAAAHPKALKNGYNFDMLTHGAKELFSIR
jgi:hypothetical protein